MRNNRIKLIGLTPLDKIPKSLYDSPHNEILQSFKLGISENRPEIKKIISLDVKIIINSHKNLFTSSSRQIILNAVKNIELVYYSSNNTVHTAKFNLPFEIPLSINDSKVTIKKVLPYVTKLSIKMLNPRSFYLYSTVFVASKIKHKSAPKASINTIDNQKNEPEAPIHKIDNKKNEPAAPTHKINNQKNEPESSIHKIDNQKNEPAAPTHKINNQKSFRKSSPRKSLPQKFEKLSDENYTQNKNVNCTCNYNNNYYYDNYWNFSYCLILVLIILSKLCPFNSYY